MSVQPAILARCAAGEISPQIAIARMLLAGEKPDPASLAGAPPDSPLARMADLVRDHGEAFGAMLAIAGRGLEPAGDDAVTGTAELFDRLAHEAPEAGVAFYSLGDAALLAAATDELLSVIERWTPLAGRSVLDLGCGIGRIAAALSPRVESVLGLDVSRAMVAEAGRRVNACPNVTIDRTNGRDLASVADRSFDLVLAVDSFPFVVRAGPDVVRAHIEGASRVLRPAGDLLVFNWSYRGDDARDIVEARELAAAHGLTVIRAGERPFRIWDGAGFHFRRDA